MRKFSANIRLPFNTDHLINSFNLVHDAGKLGHFSYDTAAMDARVLDFLCSRGISISHSEIFYTPPNRFLPIHVDGSELSNITKLNWVWGGEKSRMMWWKPKTDNAMTSLITPVNTPYLIADQKSCTMIESAVIGRPTLVNVGLPHSVINSGSVGRWCLSVVLSVQGKILQWDQAIELLADVISSE